MKAFLKRYQGFITNCLALTAMLGTCFGAVSFIQEAPHRRIEAVSAELKAADLNLQAEIVAQIATMEAKNAIRREARDKEIGGLRAEIRTEFSTVKQSLERIEQRQYDDRRKKAETEFPAFGIPTTGG